MFMVNIPIGRRRSKLRITKKFFYTFFTNFSVTMGKVKTIGEGGSFLIFDGEHFPGSG